MTNETQLQTRNINPKGIVSRNLTAEDTIQMQEIKQLFIENVYLCTICNKIECLLKINIKQIHERKKTSD